MLRIFSFFSCNLFCLFIPIPMYSHNLFSLFIPFIHIRVPQLCPSVTNSHSCLGSQIFYTVTHIFSHLRIIYTKIILIVTILNWMIYSQNAQFFVGFFQIISVDFSHLFYLLLHTLSFSMNHDATTSWTRHSVPSAPNVGVALVNHLAYVCVAAVYALYLGPNYGRFG